MSPDLRESTDRPIDSANQDLLGAHTYAKQLAEYILTMDRNFTVGVYGQWGSGKTSFVHLVKTSLGQRVQHFIEFTAWPFRTSDELWRALILRIARDLYEQPEESWPPRSKPTVPLVKRWREFLNGAVFSPPDTPDAEHTFASYDNFVAELDASLVGTIRKAPFGAFADDEQVALTVAKSVAATVATVSPFGEVLRLLLAPDDQKDDKQTNAQTRSRIDSITKFKALLSTLFDKQAHKQRVCVFVDDLDRCMPDVALDLLEAIQIFLGSIDCVFIVAADQELIGQGLKARFKDLVESAQLERDQEFYARKGREYFEKIIQFGIPVPEAGPNEGYRFIGAHFPQWAASADLIIAAIGANPRRLKQYVGLLEYRYAVATSTSDGVVGPAGGTPTADLRQRLTAIWWREPKCGEQLRQLMTSNGFTIGPDWRKPGGLDARISKNSVISSLMPSDEALSKVHTTVPATILRFADLQPGPSSTLVASDAPFLRIISRLLLGLPATTKGLLAEDATRLTALDGESKAVVDALVSLSANDDYSAAMKEIERNLGNTDRWADSAREYFVPTTAVTNELLEQRRKQLTDEPLLSSIDREVVLAYDRQRSTAQKSSIEFDPGEAVKTRTDLRVEAAEDYASRRRFAKVDVLLHVWPDLGVYLRFDRPKLLALEEAATSPDGGRETEWWGRLQQDERLRRFLNLRPDFKELYPFEVTRVAAVAQQMPASGSAPTPQAARPVEGTAPPLQPQAPPTPSQQPVSPEPVSPEQPVPAAATTDTSQPTPAERPAPKTVEKLEIPLTDQETVFLRMESTNITGSFTATAWNVNGLVESWTAQIASETRVDTEAREISEDQLQEIGRQLFASAFPGAIGDRLQRMLQKRLRLIVDVSPGSQSVSSLPWETITIDRTPVAVEGRLHVIRYLRSQRQDVSMTSRDPVRLLAVIPALKDLGPIGEGDAQHVLERLLRPAEERGMLRFSMLIGEVTRERLHDEMRKQRPNVFHFFGHASMDSHRDEGGIYLGAGDFVGAGSVARFFTDTKSTARLAVLLGAATGSGGEKGVQNGVAGRLVIEGVPTVIGTLRPIHSRVALLFSQRFYSSLFEDGDVEHALSDARKALAREKWDWSAFALFSNTTSVPRLPLRPTAVS